MQAEGESHKERPEEAKDQREALRCAAVLCSEAWLQLDLMRKPLPGPVATHPEESPMSTPRSRCTDVLREMAALAQGWRRQQERRSSSWSSRQRRLQISVNPLASESASHVF